MGAKIPHRFHIDTGKSPAASVLEWFDTAFTSLIKSNRLTYREFPPPVLLASTVRRVWTFAADFGSDHHDERIVPDGSPELIFHFGTPYLEQEADCRWCPQPRALIAGNLTRPLLLRSTGRVGVLGVRLWPHMVGRFVDRPIAETLDTRVALDSGRVPPLGEAFEALDGTSMQKILDTIVNNIMTAFSRESFREDTVVTAVVHEIVNARGQGLVERWAELAGLSQRQLIRRMVASSGMSPKQFASIVRFRAVFDELRADQPSAWLRAAVESGFFDQAHMVRAFHRFAGRSPQEYSRTAGLLSAALVQLGGR